MKTSIKIKRKIINGCIELIPYFLFMLAVYFAVKFGLGYDKGLCINDEGYLRSCLILSR